MTQLDRIEGRLQSVDDRTRAIEVRLGELRGEKRAAAVVRHVVTALLAALAGLAGGSVKLPGMH